MSENETTNETEDAQVEETGEDISPLLDLETGPSERADFFVDGILSRAGFDVTVETEDTDSNIYVSVSGPDSRGLVRQPNGVDSPVLLDALASLARRVVYPGRRESKPIVVDADDYRQRRHDQLSDLADFLHEKVSEGTAVSIYGMNSVDRRAVHKHLGKRKDATTNSEGYGTYRRLTVKEA